MVGTVSKAARKQYGLENGAARREEDAPVEKDDAAAVLSLPEAQRDKALSKMGHAEIYRLRGKLTGDKAAQDTLAPYEHRAFAREATKENPLMAIPIAAATPLYTLSKAIGMSKSRSSPSVDEVTQGYHGIVEGLLASRDE